MNSVMMSEKNIRTLSRISFLDKQPSLYSRMNNVNIFNVWGSRCQRNHNVAVWLTPRCASTIIRRQTSQKSIV